MKYFLILLFTASSFATEWIQHVCYLQEGHTKRVQFNTFKNPYSDFVSVNIVAIDASKEPMHFKRDWFSGNYYETEDFIQYGSKEKNALIKISKKVSKEFKANYPVYEGQITLQNWNDPETRSFTSRNILVDPDSFAMCHRMLDIYPKSREKFSNLHKSNPAEIERILNDATGLSDFLKRKKPENDHGRSIDF